MKSNEILKLIDRVVGTDGTLRIPSWWMHKILSDLVKYCKENAGTSVTIVDYIESQLNLVVDKIVDLNERLQDVESHELLEFVSELPSEPKENIIYLVPSLNGEGTNVLTEWAYINNTWEQFGEFKADIDLTPYLKIEDSPFEKGDANNSAVLKGEYQGYRNRALSQTSVALCAGTTAGLKGWYYSKIDFTNKKITLSDKPTYILVGSTLLNGGWSSGTPNISIGDTISLVNNSKYDLCSKVTAVSGNVITVDSLPFSSLSQDSGAAVAVIAGQFSDGYSVYVPSKPYAGVCDLGGGALSEGGQSMATNICAHAEGLQTHAYGQYSHAEGRETKAGYASHAEGLLTVASGNNSHAEGNKTKAEGKDSHAEGKESIASGIQSHAEGQYTTASGPQSHAEGDSTIASSEQSHAEGRLTTASGMNSHAEGENTKASGTDSHAEGYGCEATSDFTHAEGKGSKATSNAAHAEGLGTNAEGGASHAEGNYTIANGHSSHAEGLYTITNNKGEHACGRYNKSTASTTDKAKATLFSVGNGTDETNRKNAFEIKVNGDIYIVGLAEALQTYLNALETRIVELENIISQITEEA